MEAKKLGVEASFFELHGTCTSAYVRPKASGNLGGRDGTNANTLASQALCGVMIPAVVEVGLRTE